MRVGFLGLGIMGQPMATNIARAGHPLTVWNRSKPASEALAKEGADVADSPVGVAEASDVIFMMLRNMDVIDSVLARNDAQSFEAIVKGRTIVHLGTTLAAFSLALRDDIEAAGGSYVEAPVSGSRVPAEQGVLVGMVAGRDADVERILPVLEAMTSSIERCGDVPKAMMMKFAVNTYLLGLTTGLYEGVAMARKAELDVAQYARILEAGPMANVLMSMKLPMLVSGDYSTVQGALKDAIYNQSVIIEAASSLGLSADIIKAGNRLFRKAADAGLGDLDFSAGTEAYFLDDT